MRRSRCVLSLLATLAGRLPVAASEGGGGSSLIEPQMGTIFWVLVTFVALLVVLKRFAWKPLLGAIEAREHSIRESLDHAARQRQEAAALLEQHRQLMLEARRERAESVEKGRREGEALRSEILGEAQRQREHLLQQSELQVQAGIREAQAELKNATVDLAIRAAERLLGKNVDDATQRRLVEDHLAELERAATGARTGPSLAS